jgi:hypothetical protein
LHNIYLQKRKNCNFVHTALCHIQKQQSDNDERDSAGGF